MDLKQKIISGFNSGAYTYDSAIDVQAHAAQRLLHTVSHLNTKQILEIGCGTGYFSQTLCRLFPEANILLTDIAPEMITVCKRRLAAHSNVEAVCMDGEALTLAGKFDLIVSNMTFHWFLDFKNSLRQLFSRLTAQGQCVFTMLGANSLREWKDICFANGITTLTPSFPDFSALKNTFPQLELTREEISIAYPDALNFLKKFKALGATAPSQQHRILSANQLRRLLNAFDSSVAERKITYEIIYGSYYHHD